MLLTCHTLRPTLLQTAAALQGPVSVALGRERGRGWPNFVTSGFPFHEGGRGVMWRTGFLFFTIFCGIAKSWIFFF